MKVIERIKQVLKKSNLQTNKPPPSYTWEMVSVPWQYPEGQASVCQALQQHVINTSCPQKIIFQFNYLCYCIVASFNILRKEEVFFIIKLNLCFKSSHCFSHTPLSLPRKKGVHGGKWNKKKIQNMPQHPPNYQSSYWITGKRWIYSAYSKNLNKVLKTLTIFHSLKTENVSLMRQSIKVPEQLHRCQKSPKSQMHQQLRGNVESLCAAYKPHIHTVPSDEHVHKIPLRGYSKMGQNTFKEQGSMVEAGNIFLHLYFYKTIGKVT